MYALIDCNSFYCSCERVFRPEFIKRPVIVLSNNDGCAIALTPEAKALGIRMGAPFFQIKDVVKQHGVAVFSSNYELYGDMSARVMKILSDMAPEIEIYSIDEAFIDLDRMPHMDLQQYALEMRSRVLQWTGIPVSIGIGQTKTLAKAANRWAKKHTQEGVFVISTDKIKEETLSQIPMEDVWGIGHRLSRHLAQIGVRTALDFAKLDGSLVRQMFSVTTQRVCWELQGTRCYGLEDAAPKKQIISSRAFGEPVTTKEALSQAISSYLVRAAEKLRRQNSYVQTILVFTENKNRFRNHLPWYAQTIVGLPRPTSATNELISAGRLATERLFNPKVGYRKAGVVLLDVTSAKEAQRELFSEPPSQKSEKMMQTLDGLNRKYGSGTLQFAAQGVAPKWKMRRGLKSPCYTTRLNELCRVTTH